MRKELDRLLDEVRLLYNRIVQVGEALHADEPVTLGMRGVLEFLLRNGPATVPVIAGSRSVTRQHIQMLVNGLLDQELVALEVNPRHKRSSLVALTADGRQVIDRMREREAHLFDTLEPSASPTEVEAAAETLKQLRNIFSALEE